MDGEGWDLDERGERNKGSGVGKERESRSRGKEEKSSETHFGIDVQIPKIELPCPIDRSEDSRIDGMPPHIVHVVRRLLERMHRLDIRRSSSTRRSSNPSRRVRTTNSSSHTGTSSSSIRCTPSSSTRRPSPLRPPKLHRPIHRTRQEQIREIHTPHQRMEMQTRHGS